MITLYSLYLGGQFSLPVLAVDAVLIAAVAFLLCRHESRRKFLVAIKRKPQNIPLCVLLLAFVLYSFQLTAISNTTSYIQGNNMGLTGFVTMLFSVLLLVCCMNAFPYRKKTNVVMLTLLFVMIGVVLFCDVYYVGLIRTALTREVNPIEIVPSIAYIDTARRVIYSHMVVMAVGAALAATLPVYRKWLKKIDTSVEVADNGDMGAIDISNED